MTAFDNPPSSANEETSAAADRLQVLAELLADGDDQRRIAPASLGQRRLWFVDRLTPGGVDYNVVSPLRLVGGLDVAALVAAVGEVVGRHEVLRTRFVSVDGEPVQVIDGPGLVDVPLVDLGGLPVGARAGEVARFVREAALRPFDVAAGPLARWLLLRVSAGEHVLLMSAHHIVFDGWSASVLLRELSLLYEAFVGGLPSPLDPLPVQFADFAVWERQWLSGDVLAGQLEFWRGELAGASAVLDLPTDLPRPVRRSGLGARERVEFSPELARGLEGLCRAEGATLFMGLLAGLDVVLGRYAGVDDVVVGTFVANRGQPELEELIGFFVNTLALRCDLSGGPSFRELLRRVRSTALGAFAHQDVPFDRVVEELQPQRQVGAMPYVQVALVVQNTPEEVGCFGDVRVEFLPTDTRTAAFDLSLHVWSVEGGGLSGFVEYATDLYERGSVVRLVGHLTSVLSQVVVDPDRCIDGLALPTPTEHQALLTAAADQERAGAGNDHCLHDLVAAQIARRPDAPAAMCAGERLSYRELGQRATRLARHLRQLGVRPETLVGICVERSLDSIVSVLAVLEAGGAYLPLDPDNPAERLAYMLTDAGATTVITQARLRHLIPDTVDHLILLDDAALDDEEAEPASLSPAAGRVTVDNLAAVIYTSGSTGQPKGVAVTGRSLLNRIGWLAAERPFAADEVACLKTPIGFVDSLWELLGGQLHGIPTVVIPGDAGRDPKALVRLLGEHGITRLLLVPSLLRMLLTTVDDLATRLPRLSLWVSSGEPLSADLADLFTERMPGCSLHNLYGSAEGWDSLWSPAWAITKSGGSAPVGRPIANVNAYILDRSGHPAPVGLPGELYVGGDCLARGYFGRPDLTAERFVPHPYRPGERLYRTGDLARFRPDGQVELVGRADHQLKIRGFRVEPGEVERALETLPGVRQAGVIGWSRRDGAEPELAAYVVADGTPSTTHLRAALAELLPSHLVPTSFTLLAALPVTATGKVDRSALPEPTPLTGSEEVAVAAPVTEAERRLAEVWAEVLGMERVGVHDDFFDIGGHSLLAAQLADRVGRMFDRELPLRTVFDHPTVHQMSLALQAAISDSERPAG